MNKLDILFTIPLITVRHKVIAVAATVAGYIRFDCILNGDIFQHVCGNLKNGHFNFCAEFRLDILRRSEICFFYKD